MGSGTDAALARMLAEGRARAVRVDAHHAALWEALADATEGGKRFRPAALVTVHDALGGGLDAAAAQVGAAIELLHTAFVIHDDVIDDDHVRRGRPNVSGTFRTRAGSSGVGVDLADGYGRTAAVLAGDLALAAAVRAVATCGAPPRVVTLLLDLFDDALHTTAAGELADVRLAMDPSGATLEASLRMEQQKTSAYSFSLPLQAGAVLAGADTATVEGLREAGRAMGLAFQLLDDLVGVFADPTESGKSATSDLRSRKQTPLLVHARSTPEWVRIVELVGRDLDPGELQEVRDLLTVAGSRQFVEDLVDDHLSRARAALRATGVPSTLLDGIAAHAAAATSRGGVAA